VTTHQCDGQYELRTLRLLLCLLTDDESASAGMAVIDAELDGCPRCWRSIAQWAVHMVAGGYALQAGSTAAAADQVAVGIQRMVMTDD
jgi:hypothetical protein